MPATYQRGSGITMQGQLQKQRKLKTWAWKTYWFVLEEDQFCYFKDSSKTSSRGLIDLAQAQSIRMAGAASKGFPFEIITNTRSHMLAAASAQQRVQWLKQLQQAMLMSVRRSCTGSMHRPSCDSISEDELPEEVLHDLQRLGDQSRSDPISHPSGVETHSTQQRQPIDHTRATQQRQPQYTQVQRISIGNDLYETRSPMDATRTQRARSASTASVDEDEVFSPDYKRNHHSVCSFESSNSTSGSVSSGDVDENRADSSNGTSVFPPIPDLPNPRQEMTFRTAFDDIRLFLASNRRPDEVFAKPRRTERGGKAIERLKSFLDKIDEGKS